MSEDGVKAKEAASYRLGNIYCEKGLVIVRLIVFRLADELIKLIKDILPLFKDMPKAKTAKIGKLSFSHLNFFIVRTLFD